MNTRLQQFLAAENITQAQFADSIGVARASVSHILAGRNKPGFDFIGGMARRYPSLNLEWLITGQGKMYKESPFLFPESEIDTALPCEADIEAATPAQSRALEEQHKNIESKRNAVKVVVFYDDGTFQEFQEVFNF